MATQAAVHLRAGQVALVPVCFTFAFLVVLPVFTDFGAGITLSRPLPLGFIMSISLATLLIVAGVVRFPRRFLLLFLVFTSTLVLVLSVGLPNSHVPMQSLLHGFQVIVPFVGFIVSYVLFQRRRHLSAAGVGVVLALVLSSGVILSHNSDVVMSMGRWRFDEPILWGRFEVYQFRQYVGTVFAAALPLGLLAFRSMQGRLALLVLGVLVAVTVFGMWTAAGRLMVLASLLVICASFVSRRQVLVVITVAAFIIMLLVFFLEPFRVEFLHALARFADMGNRFPHWSRAWSEGWGGVFGTAYAISQGRESLSGAHNQLLSFLSRGGAFLVLTWVSLLFWMLLRAFTLLRVATDSPLWWGYVGLATALLFQSILNGVIAVPFEQPYTALFIWFVYGLVERAYRIESSR